MFKSVRNLFKRFKSSGTPRAAKTAKPNSMRSHRGNDHVLVGCFGLFSLSNTSSTTGRTKDIVIPIAIMDSIIIDSAPQTPTQLIASVDKGHIVEASPPPTGMTVYYTPMSHLNILTPSPVKMPVVASPKVAATGLCGLPLFSRRHPLVTASNVVIDDDLIIDWQVDGIPRCFPPTKHTKASLLKGHFSRLRRPLAAAASIQPSASNVIIDDDLIIDWQVDGIPKCFPPTKNTKASLLKGLFSRRRRPLSAATTTGASTKSNFKLEIKTLFSSLSAKLAFINDNKSAKVVGNDFVIGTRVVV